ncbi:MAG: sigma-70 family RNA polymerase sigma factor [Tannerellaceae bacterium]|jgi:RNA polymerase sigma-70 factor (ECF subfamily)|nr:sigma-70 family RNA polymerase sigma factor [Tannerellaceae bacterium]
MLSKEEFKEVFELNFDAIRDFIFYRCGNKETALDITQDVFLRIWEKRESLKGDCIKPLLYKMATDSYINHYKKELCRLNYRQSFGEEDDNDLSPEEEMIFRESVVAYTETLKQLPKTQRKVYLMSRENGMKYREIAERLHVSVKTVEKHVSTALRLLRTKFL